LTRQIVLLDKNIDQAKEELKAGMWTRIFRIDFMILLFFSKNTCIKSRSENSKSVFFCLKKINLCRNFQVGIEVLNSVENEKKNLLSQLRDYEWRLEQENKVS